jgi:mannosyl-oligosaccharide alpha-1,2-mannosidase
MAGLLALGHLHGVNTGLPGEPDDLAIAKDLMHTCHEMYARTPAGLAPEIVVFTHRDGDDFPKQHAHDIGGGDFTVKPQAGFPPCLYVMSR